MIKLLNEKYDPTNLDFDGHIMFAFYFSDDHGIPKCHCTHKYLGVYNDSVFDEQIKKMCDIVDDFFNKIPKRKRVWNFDKYELFGKEKDVPVMMSTNNKNKFLNLKKQLDMIIPDEFELYKPHITLKKSVDDISDRDKMPLRMEPIAYSLAMGDETIKQWNMT